MAVKRVGILAVAAALKEGKKARYPGLCGWFEAAKNYEKTKVHDTPWILFHANMFPNPEEDAYLSCDDILRTDWTIFD